MTQASPNAKADASPPRESWRDSVESIVVAFILALLIRGFDAEAFVIPTGSMAPTLMGRHKEIACPQCGTTYSINANDETRARGARVLAGTCPNCRYRASVEEAPSFNGDRILVMKFPYEVPWLPMAGKPERWDVLVFHYPEKPVQNYIKRLVGMPDEELTIRGGDVWTRPLGTDKAFGIERKPIRKLRAMLVPVYDDRHRPLAFAEMPDWRRWQPLEPSGWTEAQDTPGTFVGESQSAEPRWLVYRHLLPDIWQWQAVLTGTLPEPPRPSLIDDFYSYNTDQLNLNSLPITEPHWVGDLHVEFEVEVESASGALIIELIEAGVPHRVRIDLKTGEASLSRTPDDPENDASGETLVTAQGKTGFGTTGRHRVEFANIDNRMVLVVDGRPVFGDGIDYEIDSRSSERPTEADLMPVRIGIENGKVQVKDLVIRRDLYYVINAGESDYEGYYSLDANRFLELSEILRTPERFDELAKRDSSYVYPIRPGRYMMLGDNSPRSHDSRKWSTLDTEGGSYFDDSGQFWLTDPWTEEDRASYEVPEELVIGKAFFVYWPHGKPFGPDIRFPNRDVQIPFRPYLERMKWIR